MATFEFSIKELADMYKRGFEDAFIMFNDDSELESICNCSKIVTKSDEDNDEV